MFVPVNLCQTSISLRKFCIIFERFIVKALGFVQSFLVVIIDPIFPVFFPSLLIKVMSSQVCCWYLLNKLLLLRCDHSTYL